MPQLKCKDFNNILNVITQRENDNRCSRGLVLTNLRKIAEDKAATFNLEGKFFHLPSTVRSTFLMAFSPDGTKVASTHGDHKIYVCDVKSSRLLKTLEGHPRTPWCLVFHPSSNDILASGCLGGEVRVWDLHGGSEVWKAEQNSVVASIAFHPLDKVLVIATSNEIYFWDWSHPVPFAKCKTATDREKVRFVKFDPLGARLITGIFNPPSQLFRTQLDSLFTQHASRISTSRTLLSQRRNILSRLISMYRHLEGLEELSRYRESRSGSSSPSHEDALQQARDYAHEVTLYSRNTFSNLRHYRLEEDLQTNEEFGNSSTDAPEPFADNTASSSSLRLPDFSADDNSYGSIDFHSRDVISTFYRLHSICSRLERRMQEQNINFGTNSSSPLTSSQRESLSPSVASTSSSSSSETTNQSDVPSGMSLVCLLTRLQQSLQNLSNTTLSTAVAQEQIHQVRLRVSEILERLTNVSAYQARLTSLRDQIYLAAERMIQRGEDNSPSQRVDLAHCLWLVEMSLQLTRQMQRILAADYHLTQYHLNSNSEIPTEHNISPVSEVRYPLDSLLQGHFNTNTNSVPSTSLEHNWQLISDTVYERSAQRSTTNSEQELRNLRNFRIFDGHLLSPTPPNRRRSPSDSSSDNHTIPFQSGPSRFHIPRNFAPLGNRVPSQTENNSNIDFINNYFVSNGTSNSATNSQAPSQPPREELSRERMPGFLIPEVQVENTASEDPSPVVPQERPRTPPLPHILSGAEPFQHMPFSTLRGGPLGSFYESGFRPRFGGLLEPENNLTHRIQCWDFSKFEVPCIENADINIVIPKCKIHNDASVTISQDGSLIAALVPSGSGRLHSLLLAIFSLRPSSLGQCLYTIAFGSNAISVSLSPLGRYIIVGLASSRLSSSTSEQEVAAEVFKLNRGKKFNSLSFVRNLNQMGNVPQGRVSVNSAQWLPQPGQGLIYGTNQGTLCLCRPLSEMQPSTTNSDTPHERSFRIQVPRFSNHRSTQTSDLLTQTTGTQTTSSNIDV